MSTLSPVLSSERTFVLSSGERIVWRELEGPGDGIPCVLVHGLGSESRDGIPVARHLNRRVLLPDLPGFGRAGRPDRAYPVRRAGEAVLELLESRGVDRAAWIGCSYGGHVALRAALDHPERVEQLVLISSGGLIRVDDPAIGAAFEEEVLRGRTLKQVAEACRLLAGAETDEARRFRQRRMRDHRRDRDGRGTDPASYRTIARTVAGALADDAPDSLEQIRCPVTVLQGERDPLVPAAKTRRATRRFKNGNWILLEGSGHMPWLTDIEETADAVRRALRKES